MRYLLTNPVDHDAAHTSRGGRFNSLAPSHRFAQSGAAAFEPTCMAIRGWPHCRARAAVGAASAPSMLALSCDALHTDGATAAVAAAALARRPRQDVWRVPLVVLFRPMPYWPSESTHRLKARVSATEMPASWRFGTQLH